MHYFRRTKDASKYFSGTGQFNDPILIPYGKSGNLDKQDIENYERNIHSFMGLEAPTFVMLPNHTVITTLGGLTIAIPHE